MDLLNAQQSMDTYTMLKVLNSYSRLSNSRTIYVTYNYIVISNIYIVIGLFCLGYEIATFNIA